MQDCWINLDTQSCTHNVANMAVYNKKPS